MKLTLPNLNVTVAAIAALFLFTGSLSLPKANAIPIQTFEGEINGIVSGTITGRPLLGFDFGDVLIGSYSYKSATKDGVFSLFDGNLRVQDFIQGEVLLGSATLVVEGGTVKEFRYFYDVPMGTSADYNSIHASGNWDYDSVVYATFTITDPRLVPTPDTGSTVLLLGAGLLGLAAIRRRMRR